MLRQTQQRPVQNLPYPLKVLYEKPLIFKGIINELNLIDKKGFMQRITDEDDDLAMIIDAAGTTLFAFPHRHLRLVKGTFPKKTGGNILEDFSSEPFDFELFPPFGGELLTAGHADNIIYRSDNVIYPGDNQKSDHKYYHCFTNGKKPVFKYRDIYIISNLNIPARSFN